MPTEADGIYFSYVNKCNIVKSELLAHGITFNR